MSTHNICFYGELTKIILQLSSNTLLICSSASPNMFVVQCCEFSKEIFQTSACGTNHTRSIRALNFATCSSYKTIPC